MVRKQERLQQIYRWYKEETGIKEVDMHEVAKFAAKKGYPLPTPKAPLDLLAKELSLAAREETRKDEETGLPYRANHAYTIKTHSGQLTLWVDIDETARKPMLKSLVNRREQMVGDAYHLTLDADHWNRINPDEEPIQMPLDFEVDVEWRKNTPPLEDAG